MKPFKMYKFRTMLETSAKVGESISPQYDPRVTIVGRFLRRTKMNELPQFINVLKGEMTFVGPRPEAPDLADLYPPEAKRVFSVKPGLVGPATILGRNEEEVYPPDIDPKSYYIEHIVPRKFKIDLEYIENQSLFKDIKYIFLGFKETLIGALNKRHIRDNRSQIYLLTSDLILMACCYFLACSIGLWTWGLHIGYLESLVSLPVIILVRLLCNIYFHMYNSLIRYISYSDLLNVLRAITCGSFFLVLINSLTGWSYFLGPIVVIDWVCLIFFLIGFRIALRIYWDSLHRRNECQPRRRILIYGVCDGGNTACRVLTSERYLPFDVVGFVDDDPAKYGKFINGKKVLGNRHHIKALAQLYRVGEILIADTAINQKKISEIMTISQQANLKCRIWNPSDVFDSLSRPPFPGRENAFSNLLPLNQFAQVPPASAKFLAEKTFLMNGSGGAVGLEICRRLLQLGCARIIIVDRYESYLNELVAAFLKDFSAQKVVPIISEGDEIGGPERLFDNFRPNIVIHAAMRKYVPFLGSDLGDIARTNYLRTFNLARVAAKYQCEGFLMISSLLAARGGNFIADSLRVAEVSLEHFFRETNTRLIIARICDIAENRGGVVSTIENQIRNREAVTLPSAGAQIYLISKYHAAEFILHALMKGAKNRGDGEVRIFACDPGPPIPLITISEKLANSLGLRLGSDIAISFTGQVDNAPSISLREISSETSGISPIQRDGMGNLQRNNPDIKTFFKDFVLEGNEGSGIRDWKAWTQGAIKLCESIT
jgi:FlaA1/EpsC-like NDP-sugar epimerase